MSIIKPPTTLPQGFGAIAPGTAAIAPEGAAQAGEMAQAHSRFITPDSGPEDSEILAGPPPPSAAFGAYADASRARLAAAEAKIHEEIAKARVAHLESCVDFLFSPVFYERCRTFQPRLGAALTAQGRPDERPFYSIVDNARLIQGIADSGELHPLLLAHLGRTLAEDPSPWMRYHAILLIERLLALGTAGVGLDSHRPLFLSLLRRAIADADVLVAWNALSILDRRHLEGDRALSLLLRSFRPAFPSGYVYGSETQRAARMQLLLSLPDTEPKRDRLHLRRIRPIHALADDNPVPALRRPIMRERYGELRAILASSGWDEKRFFETYLPHGATVLRFADDGHYLADAHHRLAALFKAWRDGIFPEAWLADIPVLVKALPEPVFEEKPWITGKLVTRVLTLGAALAWDDILPR